MVESWKSIGIKVKNFHIVAKARYREGMLKQLKSREPEKS